MSKSRPKLTITISGRTGTGKTILGSALVRLLVEADIESVLTDDAAATKTIHRLVMSRPRLNRALSHLKRAKTFVHIKTHQEPRASLNA